MCLHLNIIPQETFYLKDWNEDICGRNNQEGLTVNENLRKQLVVIVTQAKDEEEACVGTLQDKN